MAMTYMSIEYLWRGYTFWEMGVVGGIVGLLIGGINNYIDWNMPLWKQGLIGTGIATLVELIAGLLINQDLTKWNYSQLPFNFMGHICLYFTVAWFFVALFCIVWDDFLRWKLLGEDKPRYTMF